MIRAKRFGREGWGLAAWLCVVVLFSAMAAGQERYELKDGQFEQQTQFDAASPEGQLQAIRRMLAESHNETAQKQAKAWIKQYPNHPLLVDAYLLSGDAKTARERYYESLFDYESVIRLFPGSEQFNIALEREFEIAKLFAAGVKRHFLGMRMLTAKGEAEELFIRIQERAPGSELGEKASLALGDYYYDRAEMNNAAEAYSLFMLNYPRSQFRERVVLRLIQANLATFKGPKFDSTGLVEAGQRIKQYEGEYPAAAERLGTEALSVRIDESLALKTFHNGRWYETRGEEVSAVTMYRRVVRDHPRTAASRAAIERLEKLEAAPVVAAADTTQPAATAPVDEAPADAPVIEPTEILPAETQPEAQP